METAKPWGFYCYKNSYGSFCHVPHAYRQKETHTFSEMSICLMPPETGLVHMFWRVTPGIWRSSASGLMCKNSYPRDQKLSSPESQVSLSSTYEAYWRWWNKISNSTIGARDLLLPLHRQLVVRLKDCIPTDEQVVVCRVLCAGFPAICIGQTGRCLGKLLKEHSQAVESGNSENSALADHTWGYRHPIDRETIEYDISFSISTIRILAHLRIHL